MSKSPNSVGLIATGTGRACAKHGKGFTVNYIILQSYIQLRHDACTLPRLQYYYYLDLEFSMCELNTALKFHIRQ